jgi:foldase protein PrsA
MVRDTGDGLANQEFATYLGVVIQWEATDQAAAEEFDITVSDEQVDERIDELVAESAPEAELEDYLEAVNASEDGIRAFARWTLTQEAIQEELSSTFEPVTDDDVAQEIEDFPLEWTQVCASHILVATEEEATDLKTQLDDGADFAVLATEVSLDTGSGANGGDLGCASPAGYVGPFADATMTATIGVVTDPVETEFGYHVIVVTDRTSVPSDAVRQYLEQTRATGVIETWFNEMILAADVTVEEAIGEWVTDPSPQVLASN